MAFSKVTLAFALLTISCVVFAAEEKKLQCYKCAENTDCEEKDSNIKDCEVGQKVCYIKKIKDGFERGCADNKDVCGTEKEEDCSYCEKDKCNSASGIASSLALSAVAAVLLKAFY